MPEQSAPYGDEAATDLRGDDVVLDEAATAALRAPSVLNTQPWRWRLHQGVLELRPDPSRALAGVDPEGRMLVTSCGVALHHAMVALARAGRRPQVQVLPDPTDADLLATLRAGEAFDPGDREVQLYTALQHRRTDRRPFSATPPAEEQLGVLEEAAATFGVRVHVVRPQEVVALASAAAESTETHLADPRAVQDLHQWNGGAGGERAGGAGGVPGATVPPHVLRPVPMRPLALGEQARLEPGRGEDAGARYLLLWGDRDDRRAQVQAGQALSAVLLSATSQALSCSPISEVVETAGGRHALRRMLAGLGHPYVVVRVGVPDVPDAPPATPRRSHDDAITEDAPTAGASR